MVVAPMQRSSPRASMGFSMLAASIAPSVLPAPSTCRRQVAPSQRLEQDRACDLAQLIPGHALL